MNIKDLNKAAILAVLYNRAKCQGGMGILHFDPKPMTVEEARTILSQEQGDDATQMFGDFAHNGNRLYFDYLKGRVMKVDLSKDELNTALYNRDNGPNAAEDAIFAELGHLSD